MKLLADILKSAQELLLMQERIKTMQEKNTKLAAMIDHIDHRLLRMEIYLEFCPQRSDQSFLPPQ